MKTPTPETRHAFLVRRTLYWVGQGIQSVPIATLCALDDWEIKSEP